MNSFIEKIKTLSGELTVRCYQEEDISFHISYMHDSSSCFLEDIGVDISKIPSREKMTASIRERLLKEDQTGRPTVIVGEIDGKTIGAVFFDHQEYEDGYYRLHFHIFDPELRGRGLGKILFMTAIKMFKEIYMVEEFRIEPRNTNKRMNGLMKKIGFKYLGDYNIPATQIASSFTASRYAIDLRPTRRQL